MSELTKLYKQLSPSASGSSKPVDKEALIKGIKTAVQSQKTVFGADLSSRVPTLLKNVLKTKHGPNDLIRVKPRILSLLRRMQRLYQITCSTPSTQQASSTAAALLASLASETLPLAFNAPLMTRFNLVRYNHTLIHSYTHTRIQGSSDLTDHGLSHLMQHKSYRILDLDNEFSPSITEEGLIDLFSRGSALEELYLTGELHTDEALVGIATNCPVLRKLTIHIGTIGNDRAGSGYGLACIASSCPLLTHLDLAISASMSEEGLSHIRPTAFASLEVALYLIPYDLIPYTL